MRPQYFSIIIVAFLVCGCEKPSTERHYQEIVIEAPAKAPFMGQDPHAGLGMDIPIIKQHTDEKASLAWDVPEGWREEAASGMRVATFKSEADPDAIDVSIVTLGGDAGGLESNLSRWATQIELKLAADSDLPKLIERAEVIKTASGAEAKVYDFSVLQEGQDPSVKSTIAAIMELDGSSVFVKMSGSIAAIQKNREQFKLLTQSVRKP